MSPFRVELNRLVAQWFLDIIATIFFKNEDLEPVFLLHDTDAFNFLIVFL
jgi:hypothetical protein